MTDRERKKWMLVGLLALVLLGVIWYQTNQADEPMVAGAPPRRAPRTARPQNLPGGTGELSLRPPASVEPLLATNPFDDTSIGPSEQPDPVPNDTPPPSPEQLVPAWLAHGEIEAVIEQNGRRVAIVAGRTIREGDIVGQVRIERISATEILLRPLNESENQRHEPHGGAQKR